MLSICSISNSIIFFTVTATVSFVSLYAAHYMSQDYFIVRFPVVQFTALMLCSVVTYLWANIPPVPGYFSYIIIKLTIIPDGGASCLYNFQLRFNVFDR
jgi:hypothetical protein